VLAMDENQEPATKAAAEQLCGELRDVVELRWTTQAGITLVRPDGYIAFAAHGREGASISSVREVLERQTSSNPANANSAGRFAAERRERAIRDELPFPRHGAFCVTATGLR
jgi:hypothetical protein